MDKSEENARKIIELHVKRIEELEENPVFSIILVGSLSNNSYTGNPGSDIDLIHILKNDASDSAKGEIISIIDETYEKSHKAIPISKCVYLYSELFPPYKKDFPLCLENKALIELPIEILRIKDSGETVFGNDVVDEIQMPRREDILGSVELSKKWLEKLETEEPDFIKEYNKNIQTPSLRLLVQIVITRAMVDLYFSCGKSCSSKKDIGNKMREWVPDYMFCDLLDLCVKWRYESVNDDEAEFMFSQYELWKEVRLNKGLDFVPLGKSE